MLQKDFWMVMAQQLESYVWITQNTDPHSHPVISFCMDFGPLNYISWIISYFLLLR